MSWSIARSLVVLRAEVDAQWPHRSKASDGFIGDAAHAASSSDHNPTPDTGVVCAFDITHDPLNGPDIAVLFNLLRTSPHPNCKYLIANGQIASRKTDWVVRAYHGDPHTNHIHVSVGIGTDGHSAPGTYDDTSMWLTAPAAPPPPPVQEDDDMPRPIPQTFRMDDGSIYAVDYAELPPVRFHIPDPETLAVGVMCGWWTADPGEPSAENVQRVVHGLHDASR